MGLKIKECVNCCSNLNIIKKLGINVVGTNVKKKEKVCRNRYVDVEDVLFSIYKIKCQKEKKDIQERIGVCQECAKILQILYKSHEQFKNLRLATSYLEKQFKELDSIITSHPLSPSNCQENFDDDDLSLIYSSFTTPAETQVEQQDQSNWTASSVLGPINRDDDNNSVTTPTHCEPQTEPESEEETPVDVQNCNHDHDYFAVNDRKRPMTKEYRSLFYRRQGNVKTYTCPASDSTTWTPLKKCKSNNKRVSFNIPESIPQDKFQLPHVDDPDIIRILKPIHPYKIRKESESSTMETGNNKTKLQLYDCHGCLKKFISRVNLAAHHKICHLQRQTYSRLSYDLLSQQPLRVKKIKNKCPRVIRLPSTFKLKLGERAILTEVPVSKAQQPELSPLGRQRLLEKMVLNSFVRKLDVGSSQTQLKEINQSQNMENNSQENETPPSSPAEIIDIELVSTENMEKDSHNEPSDPPSLSKISNLLKQGSAPGRKMPVDVNVSSHIKNLQGDSSKSKDAPNLDPNKLHPIFSRDPGSKGALKLVVSELRNVSFYCEKCKEIFTSLEIWREHMFTHFKPPEAPSPPPEIYIPITEQNNKEPSDTQNKEPSSQENSQDMTQQDGDGTTGESNNETLQPFENIAQLDEHLANSVVVCKQGVRYKCDKCKKYFIRGSNLRTHKCQKRPSRARKSSLKDVQCDTCSKVFRSPYFLQVHSLQHGAPHFPCKICNKPFFNEAALLGHCQRIHEGQTEPPEPEPAPLEDSTWQCAQCGKILVSYQGLKTHEKLHRPYKCQFCKKRFDLEEKFEAHLDQCKGRIERHFCPYCPRRFVLKSKWRDHVTIHTGETPHSCTICNRAYRVKGSLRVHMKLHKNQRKYHPCPLENCDKKYTNPYSLTLHLNSHAGIKPFLCSECGHSFSQKHMLECHLMRHSGNLPYPCTQCPAKFPLKSFLNVHVRDKHGEKTFICETCGKGFSMQSKLNSHARSHLPKPPKALKKCQVCGAGFKHGMSLRKHMKEHAPPPEVEQEEEEVEEIEYEYEDESNDVEEDEEEEEYSEESED